MNHQRRFGTSRATAARELAQIGTLIADLERFKELLEVDIETEEQGTSISDVSNPAYSTLARSLRTRRNNVHATLADLYERKRRLQQSAMEDENIAA
jgi:flagellar protein FliJ